MKHPVQKTLYYVTTILLSLIFITPMWMVLVNALKEKKDARFFSLALPEVPVWENFTTVIEMGGVFRAFFNGPRNRFSPARRASDHHLYCITLGGRNPNHLKI